MSVKIRSFVVRFVQRYNKKPNILHFVEKILGKFFILPQNRIKLYIMETQQDYVNMVYRLATLRGLCRNQKEFADLLSVDRSTLNGAMNGRGQNLTGRFIKKVEAFAEENNLFIAEELTEQPQEVLVPLIPTGARAGTLADFAEAVKEYDVEKIVSPVRGADYAIQVTGDSMAPEYEPGCHVLIKKVFEDQFIEWGKTYVLDSDNGAVIKKIFPTEDAAVVECRSVNPAYPPFRVRTEHVHGWYRVLMIMALK